MRANMFSNINKLNIKKVGLFCILINALHLLFWFFYFQDGQELLWLRYFSLTCPLLLLIPLRTINNIRSYLFFLIISIAIPINFTLHIFANKFLLGYVVSEFIAIILFAYLFGQIFFLFSLKIIGTIIAALIFIIFFNYNIALESDIFPLILYISSIIVIFFIISLKDKKAAVDITLGQDIIVKDILKSVIFNAKSILAILSHYFNNYNDKDSDPENSDILKEINHSIRRSKIFFTLLSKSISKISLNKNDYEKLPIDKIISLAIKNLPVEKELKDKIIVNQIDDFYFLGDKEEVIYAILNLLYYFIGQSLDNDNNRITIETRRGGFDNLILIKYYDNKINTFDESNSFKEFAFSKKQGVYEIGLSFCKRVIGAIGGEVNSELVKGEFVKIAIHLPKTDESGLEDIFKDNEFKKNPIEEIAKKPGKRNILKIISYNKNGSEDKFQYLANNDIINAKVDVVDKVTKITKMHAIENYDLISFCIDDMEAEVIEAISATKIIDKKVPMIILSTFNTSVLEEEFSDKKIKINKIICQSLKDHELIEEVMGIVKSPKFINMAELVKNNFPKIKIMVVDDQAVMRVLTSKRLKNIGMDVVLADSGKSCLRKLDEDPDVNIIMLDLHMPGMNGVESAIAIRSATFKRFNSSENIPIILYTGDSKEDISDLMMEHDINDYLAKDFSDFDILRIINKFLCSNDKIHL